MSRLIDADDFWARLPRNAENITLADITEALGGTPTIDAEPVKHGKWIYPTYGKDRFNVTECSICHFQIHRDYFPDYCPNCGAKMEEVEE